jgi:hypothetical protein
MGILYTNGCFELTGLILSGQSEEHCSISDTKGEPSVACGDRFAKATALRRVLLERGDLASFGDKHAVPELNTVQKSQPLWLLSQDTESLGAEMNTKIQSGCITRTSATMLFGQ